VRSASAGQDFFLLGMALIAHPEMRVRSLHSMQLCRSQQSSMFLHGRLEAPARPFRVLLQQSTIPLLGQGLCGGMYVDDGIATHVLREWPDSFPDTDLGRQH